MVKLVEHKHPLAIEELSKVADLVYEREKDRSFGTMREKVLRWKILLAEVTGDKDHQLSYWRDAYDKTLEAGRRNERQSAEIQAKVDAEADAISDKVPGVRRRTVEEFNLYYDITFYFEDDSWASIRCEKKQHITHPYVVSGVGLFADEHDAKAAAWAYKKYGVKRKKGKYE